jgi:hypothetical protein
MPPLSTPRPILKNDATKGIAADEEGYFELRFPARGDNRPDWTNLNQYWIMAHRATRLTC